MPQTIFHGLAVERKTTGMIDGHAHVFLRSLALLAERRYTPDRDAPVTTYLEALTRHGLAGGLVVQPSFLGTDNSYLLNALETANANENGPRLWGVVSVPPEMPPDTLAEYGSRGVVGARLNLIGRELPDLGNPAWRRFFRTLNDLDWHLEVHLEGHRLPLVLDGLRALCRKVVIDHFGLPDPRPPYSCPGFRYLRSAEPDGLWVKTTGPYRVFADVGFDVAVEVCTLLYRALAESLGPGALIWGSDWPWTQNVGGQSFGDTLDWYHRWSAESSSPGSAGDWVESLLPVR